MATKITSQDILRINELYLADPVYSHVAKIMGISATTVKKYIVPDFQPLKPREKVKEELPTVESITIPEDLASWLLLSDNEKEEIKTFKRKEVQI